MAAVVLGAAEAISIAALILSARRGQ